MLKEWALIKVTLVIVWITYGLCVQDDFAIDATACFSPDFENGQNCTLRCGVSVVDLDTYQLDNWSWQYYTHNESQYVIIYDNVYIIINVQSAVYTIFLPLANYSSGHYKCFFGLTNTTQLVYQSFKVNPFINGTELNESCSNTTECLDLNAVCESNTEGLPVCQCAGYFDIHPSINTPACLAHQESGGHCNVIDECTVPTESYDCIDTNCTCTGVMTNVIQDGTESFKCIAPARLMDSCYYDEQCQLTANFSHCDPSCNCCGCTTGYTLWTPSPTDHKDMYCYIPGNAVGSSLNGGEIAGIVISSLLCLVVVGAVIYFIVKPRHLAIT